MERGHGDRGAESLKNEVRPLSDETIVAISRHQWVLSLMINTAVILSCLYVLFGSQVSQFVGHEAQIQFIAFVPGLLGAYSVSWLAKLTRHKGWPRGLAALVPFLGLLVMLSWNGRAIGVMNGRGIRVGFLGARKADLAGLRQDGTSIAR